MKAKEIAQKALDVFGSDSQVKRFAEECVEAAHAALKFDRNGDDARLVAEIGDLRLTLWQMEQFLGEDRVKEATRRSALKLEKLIGDYEDTPQGKIRAAMNKPSPWLKRLNLGPTPPLDAELYEIKTCGCCARPKEMGRGLESLMGDGK